MGQVTGRVFVKSPSFRRKGPLVAERDVLGVGGSRSCAVKMDQRQRDAERGCVVFEAGENGVYSEVRWRLGDTGNVQLGV